MTQQPLNLGRRKNSLLLRSGVLGRYGIRQRVQKLHPDKGGDPGRFIKLTRAYHVLLRSKP